MVHALETTLQRLLEGTRQYQVPLYQRTYAWGDVQLKKLWADITAVAEDRARGRSEHTHFIGSVVLAPSPAANAVGVQTHLVVDGQQRLTTLSLLLCALRDHRAETEDRQHLERINEKYLINKWEKDAATKLLPTQADRASYLACIYATPHAGGDDAVQHAYAFFRDRLTRFDDPDDPHDVERLEEAIMTGLSLVSVTAQPGDNAHRIFESLNNTGLKLSQADLVRNYVFMRLPVRGQTIYETVWLPMQQLLTQDRLELLFWLDLVQHDENAKQADVYALQQARLDRLTTEDEIAADLTRIAELGRLLARILDPDLEPHAEVRRRLQRLADWNTTTVYPLVLHLLERRAQGRADDAEIARTLLVLESYLVRRLVAGRATSNLNRVLLRATPEIADQAPADVALRAYLSTGRKYWATDDEIRLAARQSPFYYSGKTSQRSLVLAWLEESLHSKEPVDGAKLTLEHVMPQTPTPAWRAMVAEGLGPDESVAEVYEQLLHTLGNLTLTGYNAELSNSAFEVKRTELARSGLRLNHEIAAQTRWGHEEIHHRADRLAELVVQLWPGPDVAQVETVNDPTLTALRRVLARVPAGSWTTYGDLAAVVGSHPVAVGQLLATRETPHPHRVLQGNGSFSPRFAWLDPDRSDDPRDLLASEGVRFNVNGKADPAKRLAPAHLAELAGLTDHEDAPTN